MQLMANAPVSGTAVLRLREGAQQVQDDLLTVEEPLEIRLSWKAAGEFRQQSLAVTMRTPGHDLELAMGFLFTEGLISRFEDVQSVRHCVTEETEHAGNVVKVLLRDGLELDPSTFQRHSFLSSSCGLCGKATIEALGQTIAPLHAEPEAIAAVLPKLYAVTEALRSAQSVFQHTGSIHAAGLFDREGKVRLVREDVGRHNAVDKVIGAALAEGSVPLSGSGIVVSGRAGFELVQKSLMAGIPLMAAVGAPSSLACDLAREYGMTLAGFVKANSLNLYAGPLCDAAVTAVAT
ncbi:MAG: formate dehydrogenase accessory sulfurtransferase FdhD [Bacteroidota bacterium]